MEKRPILSQFIKKVISKTAINYSPVSLLPIGVRYLNDCFTMKSLTFSKK